MTRFGERLIHTNAQSLPADIFNRAQDSLAISATGAQTAELDDGIYAVWCDDARVYIKVGPTASDVTTLTGDPVFRGNKEEYVVREGHRIGAVLASGTSTLFFHQVG